jgi:hypothetical protein
MRSVYVAGKLSPEAKAAQKTLSRRKQGFESPRERQLNQRLSLRAPALGVARACREGIGTKVPFADFREYLNLVLSILEPLEVTAAHSLIPGESF